MGTLLRDEYVSTGWVLYSRMDMLVRDVYTLVRDGYISTGWIQEYRMDMRVQDGYVSMGWDTFVRDGYIITGWISYHGKPEMSTIYEPETILETGNEYYL